MLKRGRLESTGVPKRLHLVTKTVISLAVFSVLSNAVKAESQHLQYCTGEPVTAQVSRDSPYPEVLNHRDVSGRVRVSIGRDGRVTKVVIDRSFGYPDLDAAAVKAFSQWKFRKTKCDIVLVPLTFTVRY